MAVAARRIVREIPNMEFLKSVTINEKPNLLQVAAYARVSTEKEEQEDSFERQVEHYTQLITGNSAWHMVGIYADPGISGTRAEKRPQFLKMIDDCRNGKIQKVLVKSISRFARNTVDALNYIRELKDLGISIYFESENIDTLTPGGEVLITILAAMAEQESRTISTNVKWAWQRKFKKGEIILNTGLMLGYEKDGTDEEGRTKYKINEAEAEIVRRIFREFLKGKTVTRICKELEADEIPTAQGKKKWHESVVQSILRNEKYTGNAVLGKTYKPDVLTKYRMKNDGAKAPMYYAENTHPAIVNMETFNMVKDEFERRKAAKEQTTGNSRYTSKYLLSGLLVCGECGALLRRHVRTMGTGKKIPAWGCSYRIKEGRDACNSHHVNEDVVYKTYQAAFKKIMDNSAEIIETVKQGAQLAMQPENKLQLEEIENEIISIQETTLKLIKEKQDGRITEDTYNIEIHKNSEKMKELELKQKELETAEHRYSEVARWIEAFEESIKSNDIKTKIDDTLMKILVDRIIINKDDMEVKFKCGANITQAYVK